MKQLGKSVNSVINCVLIVVKFPVIVLLAKVHKFYLIIK
jgi:hypothetical protein